MCRVQCQTVCQFRWQSRLVRLRRVRSVRRLQLCKMKQWVKSVFTVETQAKKQSLWLANACRTSSCLRPDHALFTWSRIDEWWNEWTDGTGPTCRPMGRWLRLNLKYLWLNALLFWFHYSVVSLEASCSILQSWMSEICVNFWKQYWQLPTGTWHRVWRKSKGRVPETENATAMKETFPLHF